MPISTPTYRPRHQTDGPWLADKRWAGGRIGGGSARNAIFFWCFAIFWNVVSAGAVWAGFDQVRRDKPETLLLLMFPAAGLILITVAVRYTLRRVKFGRSE